MRTRLQLVSGRGRTRDVQVACDAAADVEQVAQAFAGPAPEGGRWSVQLVDQGGRVLHPEFPWVDSGVASGQRVTVVPVDDASLAAGERRPVVRVRVVAGPDAGASVDLPVGVFRVGRADDCAVRLSSREVSAHHALLVVGARAQVVDQGSLNGVLVDGGLVDRAVVDPGTRVVLGSTCLVVERLQDPAGVDGPVEFTASPRVVPRYDGTEELAPAPPVPSGPNRFPVVAMLAPLLLGVVLFAVTRSVMSLVFVGLSPVLMAGTWVDRAWRDRVQSRTQSRQFARDLDDLVLRVGAAHEVERRQRAGEVPDTDQVLTAVQTRDSLLWSRTAGGDGFLTIHLGVGRDRSRTTVVLPPRGQAPAPAWARLCDTVAGLGEVDGVPVTVDLGACGSFGVAGGVLDRVDDVVRAVVVQLVGLHSPAVLTVVGFASPTSAPRWDWLKWLPHVDGLHAPLPGPHLAASPSAARTLLTGLEELVAARGTARVHATGPAVVVVVDDDTCADRARLTRLTQSGPPVGLHVLWCAGSVRRLPAACGAFVDLDAAPPRLGTSNPAGWRAVTPPGVSAEQAVAVARDLARVVDTGAPVLDESDLPGSVSWLSLVGPRVGEDVRVLADRWQQTSGTPNLRAVVGAGRDGPFVLDLVDQGPHALVGGTTGSGKSEFLQTWVVALAATYPPSRCTFLLVDYKGGSAFGAAVDLPHCVGLVTDLTPHLVRRALTSLRAELQARERTLAAAGAKDLATMRAAGAPGAPADLVIVVDEFAALVGDVPQFVDGMIDVAQRGRSLGLHLVLATQRPAGVIKDNLRANTNLRVGLRMADEHDSTDVLGVPLAARFDPRLPGRAAVRTGPDRVAVFQTGYMGGVTTPGHRVSQVEVTTLDFGPGTLIHGPDPTPTPTGPVPAGTDLERLVTTIGSTATWTGVPAPTRPWLPELADTYDLAALDPDTGGVAFGVVDRPGEQAQHPLTVNWDRTGTFAVYGGPGAGVSTTLRTLVAATLAHEPTEVYAVDAGAAGLTLLDALPSVGAVLGVGDRERVGRLVDLTLVRLDRRAAAFAGVRASDLSGYRAATGADEPRVLIVIDGVAALREVYENDPSTGRTWAGLTRIATEGRSLGVHLVLGVERPNGVPTGWVSAVGTRMVLRHTDEQAYQLLGVPKDILTADSPPGRGVLVGSGDEVQVAVPGGSPDLAVQATSLHTLAGRTTRPAPPVPALPELVEVRDIAADRYADPVVGLTDRVDDTGGFAPVTFTPTGTFLLAGGPGSGRTSTLIWLTRELARTRPDMVLTYIGPARSPVAQGPWWTHRASGFDQVRTVLAELTPALTGQDTQVGLVVENLPDYLGSVVEQLLVDAIRAARRNGHLVVADAETPSWTSGWPMVAEVRNGRRGLVLQPDQADGDVLFRMPFPRATRADYPPGRGVLVDGGTVTRVQVPLPGPDPT